MSNNHGTSTYRIDFGAANNRRSSAPAGQSGASLGSVNWFEKSWKGGAGPRQRPVAPAVQEAEPSTNVAAELPPKQVAKAPSADGQVESMAQLRLRADLDSMCRVRLARYGTKG